MCRSDALCVACFHRGKSLPNGPCARSTSNLDTQVLQTIATRIYFGLFVAESKFRAVKECRLCTVSNSNRCIGWAARQETALFTDLIMRKDREGIMAQITKVRVLRHTPLHCTMRTCRWFAQRPRTGGCI